MRTLAVLLAVICLAAPAVAAPPFDPFFQKFRAAFLDHDTATIKRLCAVDVEYTFGVPVPPPGTRDAAIKWWKTDWKGISQALQQGYVRTQDGKGYVSPPQTEKENYMEWRAFFQPVKGQWRCVILIRGD